MLNRTHQSTVGVLCTLSTNRRERKVQSVLSAVLRISFVGCRCTFLTVYVLYVGFWYRSKPVQALTVAVDRMIFAGIGLSIEQHLPPDT